MWVIDDLLNIGRALIKENVFEYRTLQCFYIQQFDTERCVITGIFQGYNESILMSRLTNQHQGNRNTSYIDVVFLESLEDRPELDKRSV